MAQPYKYLGDHYDGYDQAYTKPPVGNYPAHPYDAHGYGAQDYGYGAPSPMKKGGGNELQWKDIFRDLPDLGTIRQELEGPRPLRVLAALGGIGLCTAAGLKLLNFTTFFTEPWRYVVEAYILIFGLAIVIIEGKSAVPTNNKAFLYKWIPFASIVGGKGLCYIFFGTLGISLGQGHFLLFCTSAYVAIIGVIYCLIHFARLKTLGEYYNQTVYLSQRL